MSTSFGSKFSKYRDTHNSTDIGQKWKDERHKMRNRKNRGVNMTLILVIVFLILVFLYIIDFDLTIFQVD
tara:strand:+ start:1336 stop:1545 length:210 start_codon:yes stop_codon:yes gene_type:complete